MLDEYNPNILQHDTGLNILYPKQNHTTLQLNNIPDPCETATIQNVSELSEETTNNPQSITITDDSNIVQIPVHNITQNLIHDQTRIDTTQNTNRDNTSSLNTQTLR